ncbi:MAG: T9SS type A sorting domain-containing protein [Flavobacteriales bacterium]|nr:T9SS type A sorting domain-containing protein [Flavobacteriales bacterium]
MKKNYTLLTGLVLASCATFAQSGALSTKNVQPQEQAALSSTPKSVDPDYAKGFNKIPKAFLDTVYFEDFGSGTSISLPTGWNVVNNNPNNFQWVWNNVYVDGQFSNAANIISSPSVANGFMVLTADDFNTPIPATGAVAMDTYFESPTITIANPRASYWVTYDQAVRYCCSGANRLVIQASVDSFATFVEYDATNGIAVNAASDTINIINISSAVGGASDFRIRFVSEGNSHYYWMIDDFAVIEGAANDLELRTPYLEFNFDYAFNPFYGQIPYDLFPPLPVSGLVYNNGSNNATGVELQASISHQTFPGGTPGLGLVYTSASTPQSFVSNQVNDTTYYVVSPTVGSANPRFVPTVLGNFSVDLLLTGDSLDLSSNVIGVHTNNRLFATSDTIFARDDNGYGGGTGPGSYVRNGQTGGQLPGDAFGTMYIVESGTGGTQLTKKPTSITYAVSTDLDQIGVEITPTIWSYNEDSSTIALAFGAVQASSFIPYTITAADIGNLLTLPFDNGPGFMNGLDSGQIVGGWVVTNTNGGFNFEVQADASSGQFQDDVTCFIDLAHSPGWGWVDANPVIRINFADLPQPTGVRNVSTSNATFTVVPNPNNGEFKLTISSTEKVTYTLNVRNVLGQAVYTDNITVNGTVTEQMDLTQFEKGVYFVSLENGTERILKKVVVK